MASLTGHATTTDSAPSALREPVKALETWIMHLEAERQGESNPAKRGSLSRRINECAEAILILDGVVSG